jgi:hypothetical protein
LHIEDDINLLANRRWTVFLKVQLGKSNLANPYFY